MKTCYCCCTGLILAVPHTIFACDLYHHYDPCYLFCD